VIAIDRFPERLHLAEEKCGADVIDYERVDVFDALDEMTGGRGPDKCIDAVGMEGHASGLPGAYDRLMQELRMQTGRPAALRQALRACRNGGIVSVAGVYGGFLDKVPFGAIVNKGLTIKSGQTHVHRYMLPLLERIQRGDLDPSFVVTHRMALDDAPVAYEMFKNKEDQCVKVVLHA
jgi:threonine dehydrogenase-like Zn-dependent dehydrogenase